ncbi:hypothetical protein BH11CYA1_BH11CYA1_14810 [soil metagenome]
MNSFNESGALMASALLALQFSKTCSKKCEHTDYHHLIGASARLVQCIALLIAGNCIVLAFKEVCSRQLKEFCCVAKDDPESEEDYFSIKPVLTKILFVVAIGRYIRLAISEQSIKPYLVQNPTGSLFSDFKTSMIRPKLATLRDA